jgi:hypothetical protein
MKKLLLIMIVLIGSVSCNIAQKPAEEKSEEAIVETPKINALTEAEIADGWMLMFDGENPGNWRGYGKDYFPSGWQIVDGTLQCIGSGRGEAGSLEGGDIIFDEKFQNFELSIEWKISDGGNSGIFYLAQESPDKNHLADSSRNAGA